MVPEYYFKQITDMTDNTILSTIYEWMFKKEIQYECD